MRLGKLVKYAQESSNCTRSMLRYSRHLWRRLSVTSHAGLVTATIDRDFKSSVRYELNIQQ